MHTMPTNLYLQDGKVEVALQSPKATNHICNSAIQTAKLIPMATDMYVLQSTD